MQLTSLIVTKKYILKSVFVSLCITIFFYTNIIIAEPLTYSPDQWPRHWNILLDKTQLKNHLNGYRTNARGRRKMPARSPMWGVAPVAKQKSRRSVRPEYNTNSHMQNYYGQNIFRRNSAYGFSTPYVAPLMNPYGVSALAPGLAAPGIPFGAYPFMSSSPVVGGFPGTGYMW